MKKGLQFFAIIACLIFSQGMLLADARVPSNSFFVTADVGPDFNDGVPDSEGLDHTIAQNDHAMAEAWATDTTLRVMTSAIYGYNTPVPMDGTLAKASIVKWFRVTAPGNAGVYFNLGYDYGINAQCLVGGQGYMDVHSLLRVFRADTGEVWGYGSSAGTWADSSFPGSNGFFHGAPYSAYRWFNNEDVGTEFPLTFEWRVMSIAEIFEFSNQCYPWPLTTYFDGSATFAGATNLSAISSAPVVDAGQNMSVKSVDLSSTIVRGMATDPDSTALTYRWLEGTTILLDWQPVGPGGEAVLNLGSITPLSIGDHTLTVEVSDGEATSTDDMIITVANSAPHAAPTGGGTYEVGSQAILGGQVSDFEGDRLTYQWLEGTQVLFTGTIQTVYGGTPVNLPAHALAGLAIGSHAITLEISDGVNQPVTNNVTVNIVDSQAPTIIPIPDKAILWPPNHRLVLVTIKANAADNSGLPLTLSVQVTSNEPEEGLGDGDTPVDWVVESVDQATGIIVLQLRAERSGSGNGREYRIEVSATDSSNNTSTSIVKIIVPRSQGKK